MDTKDNPFKEVLLSLSLVLSVLGLFLLPDIYMASSHPDEGFTYVLSGIGLLLPIAVFVAFCPSVLCQIVLLFIGMLISMTEVLSVFTYYNYTNAVCIPALLYSNAAETNDMSAYIVRYALPHEILPLILFVVCIILVILLRKNTDGIRKHAIICVSSFCVAVVVIISATSVCANHSPYHLMREIYVAIGQEKLRKTYLSHTDQFTYKAKGLLHSKSTYALAIGESVNYSHTSLNYIYPRHTMPQLEAKRIVLYSDYYSTATYTQQALPMLLTRATPENFVQNYKEMPIQTIFRELGYKTYIVANRSQILNNGVHDYLTKGADSVFFELNDGAVVEKFKEICKRDENAFVLLHFLGNHFFYSNYPECYNKWKPNYNHHPEIKSDSLFINAYDNSLLYTDSVVANCIKSLEAVSSNKQSVFVFTSDHGEYLDAHVGGHGLSCNPTKDEYHVPLMVWYSDEYAAAHPDKVANMIKHKDEPICADHVFWSVLDMANIRIDSTLQQDGMSIFRDTLLPHRRTLLLPDGKSVMSLD